MANHTKLTIPHLLLLLLLPLLAAATGGKVGGRTQVKNVEANEEVQKLGGYCVQEYNHHQRQQQNSNGKLLVFSGVVEAETQVVSGIKYYLKISASTCRARSAQIFEAVVVVKPWLYSKQLLGFEPSSLPQNTK